MLRGEDGLGLGGGISGDREKWVDLRVIEEVESMELEGSPGGKVVKDEFQVSVFITWGLEFTEAQQLRSGIAVLWRRPAAAALIRPLA